jgi:hypothetical protein
MKSLTKGLLLAFLMLGGFSLGFMIAWPLAAQFMLAMAGEPNTNYELYETFKSSLPALGFSLLVGAVVATSVGAILDKWLKQLPWFRPQLAADTIGLTIDVPAEDGQNNDQILFSQTVTADALDGLMHDLDRETSLRLVSEDGLTLSAGYPEPSPYDEEDEPSDEGTSPMRLSLRKGRRVLYSFETVLPGRFYTPEGKNYSTCVYQLRHVGIQEESRARVIFRGPTAAMRQIFMS